MEEPIELIKKAEEELKIADHILIMTYPLVKDPKMLIAICKRLVNVCNSGMDAFLTKEYFLRKINAIPKDYIAKLKLIEKLLNIEKSILKTVKDIKEIINEHKQSAIEFIRNERLVMANDDYRLRTISQEQIKGYILKIKIFISKIKKEVESYEEYKNKRLYGRSRITS